MQHAWRTGVCVGGCVDRQGKAVEEADHTGDCVVETGLCGGGGMGAVSEMAARRANYSVSSAVQAAHTTPPVSRQHLSLPLFLLPSSSVFLTRGFARMPCHVRHLLLLLLLLLLCPCSRERKRKMDGIEPGALRGATRWG